jgi:hypothetical protein
MKLKQKTLFGFFVLLLAMMLVVTGCPSGSDDDDDEEETLETLVISGTLTSAGPRSLRAVSETQTFRAELQDDGTTLLGKLKDGAITFELSGLYNAETKVFSMQAPSSKIIFSIVGKLNDDDAVDTTTMKASVKTKNDEGEWTSTELVFASSEQTIIEEPNAETEYGVAQSVPSYWWGKLTDYASFGAIKLNFTANSITYEADWGYGIELVDVTIVEVSGDLENGPWDIIVYVDGLGAAKFYVSKTFEGRIKDAIGDYPVTDENDQPMGTLTEIIEEYGFNTGMRLYITPYASFGDATEVDNWEVDHAFSSAPNATDTAKKATQLWKDPNRYSFIVK